MVYTVETSTVWIHPVKTLPSKSEIENTIKYSVSVKSKGLKQVKTWVSGFHSGGEASTIGSVVVSLWISVIVKELKSRPLEEVAPDKGVQVQLSSFAKSVVRGKDVLLKV